MVALCHLSNVFTTEQSGSLCSGEKLSMISKEPSAVASSRLRDKFAAVSANLLSASCETTGTYLLGSRNLNLMMQMRPIDRVGWCNGKVTKDPFL
ncbi:unnamed protein product [Soboliphyme baturini]|uniref:Secreted protein n=1 Tax=Soboliphyme baturini TaxID=241478 RepID=A0A183IVB0_9BILA|nr:unnamed protein product [Soboliphyme baturini]